MDRSSSDAWKQTSVETEQSMSLPAKETSDDPCQQSESGSHRGLSRRALQRSYDFIDEKLGEKIGLQNIADAACISRFHFARLFRWSTGESPMEYLLRTRMERAKQLLAQGNLPICEIATSLGFCDQSHFSRRFHRFVGATPREFARIQADRWPVGSDSAEL
jgi:transcriptional regulator GlxA family with amidase domain